MFDDAHRLRENPQLFELLSHYAKLASADRHIWQDRLMQMGDAVEPKELSRFHGELIAFDWIEQNTGQTTPMKDGVVTACYRITLNGLREVQRIQGVEITVAVAETVAKERPAFARKKKLVQKKAGESVEGEAAAPASAVEVPAAEAPGKSRVKGSRKRKRKSEPMDVEAEAVESVMAEELEPAMAE